MRSQHNQSSTINVGVLFFSLLYCFSVSLRKTSYKALFPHCGFQIFLLSLVTLAFRTPWFGKLTTYKCHCYCLKNQIRIHTRYLQLANKIGRHIWVSTDSYYKIFSTWPIDLPNSMFLKTGLTWESPGKVLNNTKCPRLPTIDSELLREGLRPLYFFKTSPLGSNVQTGLRNIAIMYYIVSKPTLFLIQFQWF